MLRRFLCALAVTSLLAAGALAQVVRFDTSVGSFDVVLNPTHNTTLQGNVDNFLHYVNSDSYRSSWINRAAETNGQNFVLQMGGFYSNTKRPPLTIDSTRSIFAAPPVTGAPGITGLSNTVGTVSFALSGNGQGGTNRDSGTSSFFVNLASNTFLDPDFTVFAMIPDMTTVNKIMGLTQVDKTTDTNFGAGSGNLAFSNIPLQDNGQQVFILRAFQIDDAMQVAADMAGIQPALAQAIAASGKSASASAPLTTAAAASAAGGTSSSPLTSAAVPEPSSVALTVIGLLGASGWALCRRGR
jgi:cyclophilin family peptidyl-prolyl cis-trans isomerase